MTEPMPANNRGWIVVLAGIAINLVLGSLYAWGVLAKALVVDWHWSRTDAALPFTVSTAAFAVMMIFAGRMQDRLGPRVVAVLGGIMFGIGLVGSSAARSPGVMLLTYGLLGGMGIGLCYSATTPPAIKWFPAHKKGLVTGMVVSGVGLAAVYVSPLTQFLLQKTSIPQTFLILGIGATVAISLVSMFLANPPAGFQPAAAPTGAPRPKMGKAAQLDWHEMVRTAEFYRLWSMFALTASAGLMIIAHVAIIAREQARWEWGFVPVALLAIFNTLGRIVSGYVSDRIGRRETMLLAFVLQAVNMLAFAFYTTPGLLVFGSAFTGLCYGTIFTLMPAATADSYGVKNLGVNYGLVFTAFGVAGILGPILGGRIRDLSGSYTASYVISAVMLLIGAGLAFRTRKSQAAEPAPSRAR
ncbi:MAG TPA: OFA family MFS transporter [Candidatus Baltobacteraceae bacterium]|nr:OFA family MFS transporter [Candidatus Baltobacteraceae bacterium]